MKQVKLKDSRERNEIGESIRRSKITSTTLKATQNIENVEMPLIVNGEFYEPDVKGTNMYRPNFEPAYVKNMQNERQVRGYVPQITRRTINTKTDHITLLAPHAKSISFEEFEVEISSPIFDTASDGNGTNTFYLEEVLPVTLENDTVKLESDNLTHHIKIPHTWTEVTGYFEDDKGFNVTVQEPHAFVKGMYVHVPQENGSFLRFVIKDVSSSDIKGISVITLPRVAQKKDLKPRWLYYEYTLSQEETCKTINAACNHLTDSKSITVSPYEGKYKVIDNQHLYVTYAKSNGRIVENLINKSVSKRKFNITPDNYVIESFVCAMRNALNPFTFQSNVIFKVITEDGELVHREFPSGTYDLESLCTSFDKMLIKEGITLSFENSRFTVQGIATSVNIMGNDVLRAIGFQGDLLGEKKWYISDEVIYNNNLRNRYSVFVVGENIMVRAHPVSSLTPGIIYDYNLVGPLVESIGLKKYGKLYCTQNLTFKLEYPRRLYLCLENCENPCEFENDGNSFKYYGELNLCGNVYLLRQPTVPIQVKEKKIQFSIVNCHGAKVRHQNDHKYIKLRVEQ